MKKLFALTTTLGFWFLMGSSTLAMCLWFAPEGRIFEPAANIQSLLIEEGGNQSLVVQPQWSGDVTDFGLVMPFTTQPEIEEAPEEIFTQLEDLTNPFQSFDDIVLFDAREGVPSVPSQNVEVIETREIGDYTATTLSATDATELESWLVENNYVNDAAKSETLQYYIDNGSQFFVALRVNTDAVNLEVDGSLRGELKPLQFNFVQDELTLPLRLMAGEDTRIDLTIYTLSDEQQYIPGAELLFARKVTAADTQTATSLDTYDAQGQWLVRNSIQFNPAAVETDITLLTAEEDVIVENGITKRVNPDLLDANTGLIEAAGGELVYTEARETSATTTVASDTTEASLDSPIIIGIIAILGISNIVLINMLFKRNQRET